jgi:hypothetical protein
MFGPSGRLPKKLPFAAQHIFSTILRLASLQIQNSPFRLKHWICRHFALPAGRQVRQELFPKKSEFALQGNKLSFSHPAIF